MNWIADDRRFSDLEELHRFLVTHTNVPTYVELAGKPLYLPGARNAAEILEGLIEQNVSADEWLSQLGYCEIKRGQEITKVYYGTQDPNFLSMRELLGDYFSEDDPVLELAYAALDYLLIPAPDFNTIAELNRWLAENEPDVTWQVVIPEQQS